jgi:hypothetical protein
MDKTVQKEHTVNYIVTWEGTPYRPEVHNLGGRIRLFLEEFHRQHSTDSPLAAMTIPAVYLTETASVKGTETNMASITWTHNWMATHTSQMDHLTFSLTGGSTLILTPEDKSCIQQGREFSTSVRLDSAAQLEPDSLINLIDTITTSGLEYIKSTALPMLMGKSTISKESISLRGHKEHYKLTELTPETVLHTISTPRGLPLSAFSPSSRATLTHNGPYEVIINWSSRQAQLLALLAFKQGIMHHADYMQTKVGQGSKLQQVPPITTAAKAGTHTHPNFDHHLVMACWEGKNFPPNLPKEIPFKMVQLMET